MEDGELDDEMQTLIHMFHEKRKPSDVYHHQERQPLMKHMKPSETSEFVSPRMNTTNTTPLDRLQCPPNLTGEVIGDSN